MKTGIELITDERVEQIKKHGYKIEIDVNNNGDGQLIDAARSLLKPTAAYEPEPYNWDVETWNKMRNKSFTERYIIAGAFIAAELDRIQNT